MSRKVAPIVPTLNQDGIVDRNANEDRLPSVDETVGNKDIDKGHHRKRGLAARPRMIDIAKRAGVSVATVSLALRDHPSIGQTTRERIREIVKEIGYRAGHRNGGTDTRRHEISYCTVGVDMRDVNYLPFLDGIAAAAKARGITLKLEAFPPEASSLRALWPGQAIERTNLIVSGRLEEAHIRMLSDAGIPFVVVGNYQFETPCHMVSISLEAVCRRAMEEFRRKGVRRIISLVEVADRAAEREFLRHLLEAARDAGISESDCPVIEFGLDFQNAIPAIDKALALCDETSHILTCEKHATECLLLSPQMRAMSDTIANDRIVAFATSPPNLPRFAHCRVFDLGAVTCGRLAVDRLLDLIARRDTPPSISHIFSPGWT